MSVTTSVIGETVHAGTITVHTQVQGLAELDAMLARLEADGPVLAGNALYAEAQEIMTASKEECPVDTGALRASGHVTLPVVTPTTVSVEMGYGGVAIPYALRQHEEMSYRHTVGKAKYLEDPLRAAESGMLERIASRMRSEMAI